MMRLWLTALVLALAMFGCSGKSTGNDDDDDNQTTNQDPNGAPNNIACIACGPAAMCGETCNDPCGCCCDEGEERVRDGDLQRCTSAQCWDVVGPAPPDMGAANMGVEDAGSQTDAGSDEDVGTVEDAGPTECTESPNGDSPPTDTCSHGGAEWIAWKWVAPRDMELQTLRMHTDEGSGAFFADDADKPGAVLFEGELSAPDADGWRDLSAPDAVAVTAGTTYWVGENVSTCSTAEAGTEWDYYTSDSTAGPWTGPFNAHPFTAQLIGLCD